MREVALPDILAIDMVVDIDSFLDGVAAQPTDVLPRHTRPQEVRCEPVAAAVGPKTFFQWSASLMQANPLSCFRYGHTYRMAA